MASEILLTLPSTSCSSRSLQLGRDEMTDALLGQQETTATKAMKMRVYGPWIVFIEPMITPAL